jgi:hypothetical protein
MDTNTPTVGQHVTVRGLDCIIIRVYSAGTLDAQAPDGRCFRLTGLNFR